MIPTSMAKMSLRPPPRPQNQLAKQRARTTWAGYNRQSEVVVTPPKSFVILNLFQDNAPPLPAILKQVQDDDMWCFMRDPLRQ
jgi:hypothetical protein